MKKKTKKLPRPQKSSRAIREDISTTRADIKDIKHEMHLNKSDLRTITRDVAWGVREITRRTRVLERSRAALPKAIEREKATARRLKKAAKAAARKAKE